MTHLGPAKAGGTTLATSVVSTGVAIAVYAAYKFFPRSADLVDAGRLETRPEPPTITPREPTPPDGVPAPARGRIERQASRVVLAAAVGLSGIGISVVSFPNTFGGFTRSTTSPTNGGTAGTLQMTESVTGAVVTFSNAKPGDSTTGTLSVKNSGTLPANSMTLAVGTANNSACPANTCPSGTGGSTDLSGLVTISVVDSSRAGAPVVFGPITIDSAVANQAYALPSLGGTTTWASGESHSLSVTVSMPNNASDAYQGTSTTFPITFAGAS